MIKPRGCILLEDYCLQKRFSQASRLCAPFDQLVPLKLMSLSVSVDSVDSVLPQDGALLD
jgi:hypothetical protein